MAIFDHSKNMHMCKVSPVEIKNMHHDAQVVKYRHYGVYRTGEAADREQEVLTNPVTVLDR